MTSRFIVYACPVGALAQQVETFFAKSKARFGPNAAHRYMPHCTLTGFFDAEETAIAPYLQALDATLTDARPTQPDPAIAVVGMTFRPNWHGLELHSNWIKDAIARFAQRVQSLQVLRLKDWLHLSLAYEFPPEQHAALEQLARHEIDPTAPVDWELRFYQCSDADTWTCHQAWML